MPTQSFLRSLQDHRAERQLVSLVSLYPEFFTQARGLKPEQFSNVEARAGWSKIVAAFEAGLTPDPVDYLSLQDLSYPPVPLRHEAEALVDRVSQSDYRLNLIRYAEALVLAVEKRDIDAAQALLSNPPRRDNSMNSSASAPDIASRLWDAMESQTALLPTGLYPLDKVVGGGYESQTLTILMARPGMGKTAAIVQAADMATRRGLSVLVLSKEMSEDQFVRRLATRRAELPVNMIKSKTWSEAQQARYADELSGLMERKTLFVDGSTPQTTAQVMERCAEIKHKYGRLDFVMADHLRLFADRADNETHRLGAISWGFKRIAKELDTRVIVASQLNRSVEGQSDKRPDLKDLRDSGEIEENADNVISLYRDKYYTPESNDIAEFIAAKARDGERNLRITCDFISEWMSFDWRVM